MIFCCFLFVLRQLAVAEGDVDALFLISPLLPPFHSLLLPFSLCQGVILNKRPCELRAHRITTKGFS